MEKTAHTLVAGLLEDAYDGADATRGKVLRLLSTYSLSVPSLTQLEHGLIHAKVSGRKYLRLLEPGDLARRPKVVGTIVRFADYDTLKDLVERGVITRKELDAFSVSGRLTAAHMAAIGGNLGAIESLVTPEDLLIYRGSVAKFTALDVAADYDKLDKIPPALLRKATAIQTARQLGESKLDDQIRLQRHNERLARLFWATKTAAPEEAIEVYATEKLSSDDLVARPKLAHDHPAAVVHSKQQ